MPTPKQTLQKKATNSRLTTYYFQLQCTPKHNYAETHAILNHVYTFIKQIYQPTNVVIKRQICVVLCKTR